MVGRVVFLFATEHAYRHVQERQSFTLLLRKQHIATTLSLASHNRCVLVGIKGIEPFSSACHADVLPVN